MQRIFQRIALLFICVLSVLGRAAPACAEDRREIHVSVRPRSVAANVDRWAYYPGTGLTIFGDKEDFEKATNKLIIFVYDKDADPQGNCTLKEILDKRGDEVRPDPHQPEGGLSRCSGSGKKASERPKGWDAEAGRALAGVGAVANLSSPEGEKGGSPYGVAGGMNPTAESSPGLQAAVATVQIALSAAEMKQMVERATRFVVARLTRQAEIEAVEKAALEGIEQLAKEGRAVSREAIEEAAREAARKAERALPASGGGKVAGGATNGLTTVHVPGPRKPPPLGASGTPLRSGEISGRGGTKLGPDPAARGSHTTFKRDPQTGKLTSHAEWDAQGMPVKRTDIIDKAQHGIEGPHTHEYGSPNVNPQTGKAHPGREVRVVPARPEELPK